MRHVSDRTSSQRGTSWVSRWGREWLPQHVRGVWVYPNAIPPLQRIRQALTGHEHAGSQEEDHALQVDGLRAVRLGHAYVSDRCQNGPTPLTVALDGGRLGDASGEAFTPKGGVCVRGDVGPLLRSKCADTLG